MTHLALRSDMTVGQWCDMLRTISHDYNGKIIPEIKIPVIKIARAVFHLGLLEAKNWVEEGCPYPAVQIGAKVTFKDYGVRRTGEVLDIIVTPVGTRFLTVYDPVSTHVHSISYKNATIT